MEKNIFVVRAGHLIRCGETPEKTPGGAGLIGIFIAKGGNSGESSKRETIGKSGWETEKGMTKKWQTKKWASGNVFWGGVKGLPSPGHREPLIRVHWRYWRFPATE
jgi:hypothetical protein